MPGTTCQPHAVPLSPQLIASLTRAVGTETGGAEPSDVVFHDSHSNDVMELRFDDGRTLMVKRGRYDWVAPRFRASRLASELLQEQADIVAPAPLQIPEDLAEQPLEAYWRVDLPTLQELWPSLPAAKQAAVLRSWGELVGRLHAIRVRGHGPLCGAAERLSFADFLGADLGYRLYPALAGEWPESLGILEALRQAIPSVTERVPIDGSILLHNDMHMGNVLCEVQSGRVRCVGLLDLETAFAGPPEADLAIMEVHHGPLFDQPIDGDWFDEVRAGYARPLDPVVMTFFRAYHLLNMGFYSVLVGHREHADRVAAEASREVELLAGMRTAA
jgi:aminoglycoside phosphotransferase (APT) family kinase protein